MPERKPTPRKAPEEAPAHDYRRARAETRGAVREAAVDAAIELLEEGGPDAVTVRKVAAMVGASTQVIYTLFGGKPGLAGAVFGRGHELLAEALRSAPKTANPLTDLRAEGRAYRRRALEDPHLYQAMFGSSLGEMEPDGAALEAAAGSFGELVASVERCQAAGQIRKGDPLDVARVVFSTCHGASALELAGRRPDDLDPDRVYEQVMDTLLAGLAPGAKPASKPG
jgi:AcrR family transcriptional regulator